jgi:hypothetical protein
MAEAAEQSLYDRLGGVYAIAAVIDDFINRLLCSLSLRERERETFPCALAG